MRRNRNTIARFEEHSLALFTALVVASAGAAAQSEASRTEGAAVHVQASGRASDPPTRPAQRHMGADEAFGRADSNGDSRLSRDEAQRLPAIWERFEDIDANKDGFLSRDEFHRGIAN